MGSEPVKWKGKQSRQSLRTDSLPEAWRKLAEFKRDLERVDPHLNRKTLDSVVDLYLETVAGQALGTIKKKRQIGALIKAKWKGVLVRSIKKSDILSWLASFPFGTNTRNKYLRITRAIFQLAADDKVIAYSPLLGVKEEKVPQPIRKTPTMAEFRALLASIRTQPFSDTAESSLERDWTGNGKVDIRKR
jgi:site-specific recombinase XerD